MVFALLFFLFSPALVKGELERKTIRGHKHARPLSLSLPLVFMTATASPRGTSPPQLPHPPPQKSPAMPAERRKGRRAPCFGGLSCFGGSPVADSDDAGRRPVDRGRRAPSFTWPMFRKKKKTVPVDAPAPPAEVTLAKAASDRRPEAAGEDEAAAGKAAGEDGKEEAAGKLQHHRRTEPTKAAAAVGSPGQSFFWKLRKGNKDNGGFRIHSSGSHKDHISESKPGQTKLPPQRQQRTRLPFISTKYDARRGSPARTPREGPPTTPTRTSGSPAAGGGTLPPSSPAVSPGHSRTPPTHAFSASRLGGTRAHKKASEEPPSSAPSLPAGRDDQVLGLSVMAVVLVMMVLFGRVSAVVVTCLWFYCLPRLRVTMAEADGGGSKGAAVFDLDSEEYKKRVILEGLLQRNVRRPAGLP